MTPQTKQQAAVTRNAILDAAEDLFANQGVARTTLQDIAALAGVARGAVYRHFDGKASLFDAMMSRATISFEGDMSLLDHTSSTRPLEELRNSMISALRRTNQHKQLRRVLEITNLKVELASELRAIVLRQRRNSIDNWIVRAGRCIVRAKQLGFAGELVDERAAARDMWIMTDGLIRNWLLDPEGFELVNEGKRMIDTYLAGLQKKRRQLFPL